MRCKHKDNEPVILDEDMMAAGVGGPAGGGGLVPPGRALVPPIEDTVGVVCVELPVDVG
jgi:hypothetical protein